MDPSTLQADRVLLTVFVSVLVGFVTAVLSIVRLVNDKENKTTDYRQGWTDSLRKCFAELISNINALAGAIVARLNTADQINDIIEHELDSSKEKLPPGTEGIKDYLNKSVLADDAHVRDLRRSLHQSYALTRLHFKPNDLSFSRVEQKFDVILEMLDKLSALLGETAKVDRMALREKVHAAAADITNYSRDILKTEWETVKKGEPAYQHTKLWSLIGGGVALIILLAFGAFAGWNSFQLDTRIKSNRANTNPAEKSKSSQTVGESTDVKTPLTSAPLQNSQIITIYPAMDCPAQVRNSSRSVRTTSQSCIEKK